ncbi:MAG: helix-turn-helix transcriptional regulator [Patescibacteria group bacterium]
MKKEANIAVTIGKRIRELRLAKNLSQEKLAAAAGLHVTYISMVETGKKNITVAALNKVCKSLGVSLGEFFA